MTPMTPQRFSLPPVPQLRATVTLLIAAYSTPVLALLGTPLSQHGASAVVSQHASAVVSPHGASAVLAPPAVAAAAAEAEPVEPAARYSCPMHPDVHSDKPGRCPHCGMKLEEKKASEPKGDL